MGWGDPKPSGPGPPNSGRPLAAPAVTGGAVVRGGSARREPAPRERAAVRVRAPASGVRDGAAVRRGRRRRVVRADRHEKVAPGEQGARPPSQPRLRQSAAPASVRRPLDFAATAAEEGLSGFKERRRVVRGVADQRAVRDGRGRAGAARAVPPELHTRSPAGAAARPPAAPAARRRCGSTASLPALARPRAPWGTRSTHTGPLPSGAADSRPAVRAGAAVGRARPPARHSEGRPSSPTHPGSATHARAAPVHLHARADSPSGPAHSTHTARARALKPKAHTSKRAEARFTSRPPHAPCHWRVVFLFSVISRPPAGVEWPLLMRVSPRAWAPR